MKQTPEMVDGNGPGGQQAKRACPNNELAVPANQRLLHTGTPCTRGRANVALCSQIMGKFRWLVSVHSSSPSRANALEP